MSESYTGIENLEVMQEAHNYNSYLVNILVSEGRGAVAALDFGAGIGTFASELRNCGIHVICIEPDYSLLRRLKAKAFEVHDSLDAIPEKSVSYIYSLNVLEHIEDDLGALGELYHRLRPGGKLVIYVPAFKVLFSSADKVVGHRRRYTKTVLLKLLETAGFEVDQARYVDSLGFAVTLIFKVLGNKEGKVSPLALKLFDRFLFPLSVTLDHVMSRIAGKNLLVRARRPSDDLSSRSTETSAALCVPSSR